MAIDDGMIALSIVTPDRWTLWLPGPLPLLAPRRPHVREEDEDGD
jgi:hypothetical protein